VLAADGECGRLERVVVDPWRRSSRIRWSRPCTKVASRSWCRSAMVDAVDDQHIQLRSTTAELAEFDDAEDVQFLAADADVLATDARMPCCGPTTPS
jgi:hypothetical protein